VTKKSDQFSPVSAEDSKGDQFNKEKNAAETGSQVDALDRSKSAEGRCSTCLCCDGSRWDAASGSLLNSAPKRRSWSGAGALPASAHGAEPNDAMGGYRG